MSARRSLADFGVVPHVAEARPNVLRELIQMSMKAEGLITLAGGFPAEELFDSEALEAAARAAFRSNTRTPLQYDTTEGFAPLRNQLAELSKARGVAADPARLVVTSGSQQAIDITARCLVAPGDVVLVERPTFITALQTFRAAQAHLMDAPDDAEGPEIDALEARIAQARGEGRRVKLLYLIPNFSNPSGRVIGLERRRELLALAAREGITILEDDPYGELWFDAPPPPAIAALAADDPELSEHVVYVSSLSKTVSPGLRIGWAVLPEGLVRPYKLMKSTADIHSSVLAQATADAYLRMERLPRRVAEARALYARKARALSDGLRQAGGFEFDDPTGGMFLWTRLPAGHDAAAFSRHAIAAQSVAAVPGDPFFAIEPEAGRLRLSFSQGSEADLAAAAERLGLALQNPPR